MNTHTHTHTPATRAPRRARPASRTPLSSTCPTDRLIS
jgi:hypothetical protein